MSKGKRQCCFDIRLFPFPAFHFYPFFTTSAWVALLACFCRRICFLAAAFSSCQDADAQSTPAARAQKRQRGYCREGWNSQHCTLLIIYLLVIACRHYWKNNFAASSNFACSGGMWHFSANIGMLGQLSPLPTDLYRALSKQQKILAVENILITKTCFYSSRQASAPFLNFL